MSASPRSLAVAAIVGLAGCCDAARPPHRGLVQGAVDIASREPGTGPTTSEERACRVRGSLLTLAGEEVVLCDRPNRRCFGRISGNRTSSNILSLVLSSAEHARLALVAQGVVVEASVAVDALALHPSGPFPIEGYFLSTKSQVEVLKVRGDTVEIGVPSGRELRPLEPLEVRWPCERPSTELQSIDWVDVGAAFHLGEQLTTLESTNFPLAARATPRGPWHPNNSRGAPGSGSSRRNAAFAPAAIPPTTEA